MPLAQALADFTGSLAQCDHLIASAHQQDAAGVDLFSLRDREQITVAAFLNMFIAWETFVEETMLKLMTGLPTISGQAPARYVTPPTIPAARRMIVGVQRFFDFSHHENFKKMCFIYFDMAYPFEPHLSAIALDLSDLKTIRNACAHISGNTQNQLETLSLRIFAAPRPGISVYTLITSPDPRAPPETVFSGYRNKLAAAADLIANG